MCTKSYKQRLTATLDSTQGCSHNSGSSTAVVIKCNESTFNFLNSWWISLAPISRSSRKQLGHNTHNLQLLLQNGDRKYAKEELAAKPVHGHQSSSKVSAIYNWTLRSVGVIHFLFYMFSNFHNLDLNNKTCVAIANMWWSINNSWIENWTSLDLVIIIRSACFLIPSLNKLGFHNCVHYWVWSS